MPLFNMILPVGYKLNEQEIIKILQKLDTTRLNKLKDYYDNKTAIRYKKVSNPANPNNRVSCNYAKLITDVQASYVAGEPIVVTSTDEDAIDALKEILKRNDFNSLALTIATDMSIYGRAYMMVYTNEDAEACISTLSPLNVAMVYDNTLDMNTMYGIRTIECYDLDTDLIYYEVEVWDDEIVTRYKSDSGLSSLTFLGSERHYFNCVPIVEFLNNDSQQGDFENVISLIDNFELLMSEEADTMEAYSDAFLVFRGWVPPVDDQGEVSTELLQKMREAKTIFLEDEAQSVDYLIKGSSSTDQIEAKNRIEDLIFKFSQTPNLSDEAFSGNSSGVAIKYKLMGIENKAVIKERFMTAGLQQMVMIIFNLLNLKFANYAWRDIEFQFTRNIPTNEQEIAAITTQLRGLVSNHTLLSQIPFVKDVQREEELLEQEKEFNPFFDIQPDYEEEGDFYNGMG